MTISTRLLALAVVCLLACVAVADADEIKLTVSVKSSKQQIKSKFTRIAPAKRRPKLGEKPVKPKQVDKSLPPRPVFKGSLGEELVVQWQIVGEDKATEVVDLIVHFFVVKTGEVGVKKVPKLGKDAVQEGLLSMDLKPKKKASGEFTMKLEKSGSYLVRVETIGMAPSQGCEYFAALDLLIE